MYLLAATKKDISNSLLEYSPLSIKQDGFYITVLTDGFFSNHFEEDKKITIIDSPLENKSKGIFFVKITMEKSKIIVKNTLFSGKTNYYYMKNGDFILSSHIKLFRKVGIPIRENREVLPEFFLYREVMPPVTMYKDIMKMNNGATIIVKKSGDKWKDIQVINHDFKFPNNNNTNIEKIVEKTDKLINNSLEEIKESKDKISVLLSGGLDSSILLRMNQEKFGINHSYSTGYPFIDDENREKEYALSAAEALNSHHHYYETDNENYLKAFIESVKIVEEPVIHLQSVMFNLLFKEGIPGSKNIILNGGGADGIWGTVDYYIFRRNNRRINRLLSKKPFINFLKAGTNIAGKGKGYVRTMEKIKKYDLDYKDPESILWDYETWGEKEWVKNHFNVNNQELIRNRKMVIGPYLNRSYYDIISIIDGLTLIGITFSFWTKLAENSGKTIHYSYYNQNIVDYTYTIPWEVRISEPKRILRKLAKKHKIPDFIIKRPKSGFAAHPKYWSKENGIFEPLLPLVSKYFDSSTIKKMKSPDLKKSMIFWGMLNYTLWMKLMIENIDEKEILSELSF